MYSTWDPGRLGVVRKMFTDPLTARINRPPWDHPGGHNVQLLLSSRALSVTPQRLNPCNLKLFMDVIKGLNQFGTNSIKSFLNSKVRSVFHFSFELCWPAFDQSVQYKSCAKYSTLSPEKKLHFSEAPKYFPKFLLNYVLIKNCFRKNKFLFLNGLVKPTS
jgi:hypothetical protein